MLYETAARASEVLPLNSQDLDLESAAPRSAPRGDTEWPCWGSGTAHLPPRLIRCRQAGPVFLSERRPGPASRPAAQDLCPATAQAPKPSLRSPPCSNLHVGDAFTVTAWAPGQLAGRLTG